MRVLLKALSCLVQDAGCRMCDNVCAFELSGAGSSPRGPTSTAILTSRAAVHSLCNSVGCHTKAPSLLETAGAVTLPQVPQNPPGVLVYPGPGSFPAPPPPIFVSLFD